MTKQLFSIAIIATILSCGPDPIPVPEAAVLVSPENANTCTTAQSVNSGQSRVTFTWLEANNTETYDIVVRNGITGAEQRGSDIITFETNFVLDKGAPYSWSVTSKSTATTETSQSTTWQFYLEGVETPSYVPFPALLVAPAQDANVDLSSNTSYTFQWEGSDLDDDIIHYNLKLGTSSDALNTVAESVSGNSTDVTLVPSTSYYWQVETVDSQGSISLSVVSTFTTL